MMKTIYSLSTGIPTIDPSETRGRSCCRRFISSVSSCSAWASFPSMVFCTAAFCLEAANSPCSAERSPCRRARLSFSRESCSCLPCSSRLSTCTSPRMTNSSSSRFVSSAVRSCRTSSILTGCPNFDRTNSRMMAPNPQQMQSRNERLNISRSRRRAFMMLKITASPARGRKRIRRFALPGASRRWRRQDRPPWDTILY